MHGMAGIYSPIHIVPGFEGFLEGMVAAVSHRGPEPSLSRGSFAHAGRCGLGVVGSRPVQSMDGRLTLAFNGEIYNYAVLRERLAKAGHCFNSECGAEVIIHLYEQYGERLFNEIDGQYAFSIYDKWNNSLFLARDRLGICPLFYTVHDGAVYFGSEIKSLLAAAPAEARLSADGVYEQFVYWAVSGGRTVFEDIYQVPPACYITFDGSGKSNLTRYHAFSDYLTAQHEIAEQGEAVAALRETLLHSLMERITHESEKWGVYLSGGLDSTILLRLLYQAGFTSVPVFSLGFDDNKLDETAFQKLAAHGGDGAHTRVQVCAADIAANLRSAVFHCEAPLFKLGPVPMYLLSKAAEEEGVKFVISGEGADELFYGYDLFKETLFRWQCALNPDSDAAVADIRYIAPPTACANPMVLEGYKKYYARNLDEPHGKLFSVQPRVRESSAILDYFEPSFREKADPKRVRVEQERGLCEPLKGLSPLARCQEVQMQNLLAGYLLSSQGDRMLAAHAVEGRFPFLDRHVIELAAALPDSLKLNRYSEKHILKEAFRGIVPSAIINRAKYQYSTPGSEILLEDERTRRYLSKHVFDRYGVFDYKAVSGLTEAFKQKKRSGRALSITEDMILVYAITTHMLMELFNIT